MLDGAVAPTFPLLNGFPRSGGRMPISISDASRYANFARIPEHS